MRTGLLRKKSRHSAGFFSYLLLVPTPRRALRAPSDSTHANFVCAGRWALVSRDLLFVTRDKPPFAEASGDRPPRRFAAPLRRGELCSATVRSKFPSIGGVSQRDGVVREFSVQMLNF